MKSKIVLVIVFYKEQLQLPRGNCKFPGATEIYIKGHFYKSRLRTAAALPNFIFGIFRVGLRVLLNFEHFPSSTWPFWRCFPSAFMPLLAFGRTDPLKAKCLGTYEHLDSAQVVGQIHQSHAYLGPGGTNGAQQDAPSLPGALAGRRSPGIFGLSELQSPRPPEAFLSSAP